MTLARWAAGLVAAYTVVLVVYAVALQSANGWVGVARHPSVLIRAAALAFLAWAVIRRFAWAWWVAVTLTGYWLLTGLVSYAVLAIMRGRGSEALRRLPYFMLVAGVRYALLAGALTLLLLPRTRAAFPAVPWLTTSPAPTPGGESPAWSVKPSVIQLLLAVTLVLSSTMITVVGGHGGLIVGQLVVLSPAAAAVGAVVTLALIAAAVRLDAGLFALCCSVVALPVIYFLVTVWTDESFFGLSIASAVPFIATWIGIVARAARSQQRAEARAAA